jgi:hypothetical protein
VDLKKVISGLREESALVDEAIEALERIAKKRPDAADAPVSRRRGRPPGSPNKPKSDG